MFIKYHVLLGLIFSFFLLLSGLVGFTGFLIVFLSSFLIDLDHYVSYALKKKDFSLINAYRWHMAMDKKFLSFPRQERNKIKIQLCFLHGLEILLVLAVLSVFIKSARFVFVGVLFHLSLDLAYGKLYYNDRLDKVSIIYDFFKYKKLRDIAS